MSLSSSPTTCRATGIDKEFSCDAMETYTFYVAAGRAEHRAAACDYIDWTTTGRFQQNLGTI